MLNFTKSDGQSDLSGYMDKIRILSSKVELKISQKDKDENDAFIETLSVEELKDIRQVIHAAEYLLTKYQDKKEIKSFLQEFVGIVLHAVNSVNGMKDNLEDLVMSAEFALCQIQTLHADVTRSLVFKREPQTRIDDFKIQSLLDTLAPTVEPVKMVCVEAQIPKQSVGAINLTNSSRRVNTGDYLERTAVEI